MRLKAPKQHSNTLQKKDKHVTCWLPLSLKLRVSFFNELSFGEVCQCILSKTTPVGSSGFSGIVAHSKSPQPALAWCFGGSSCVCNMSAWIRRCHIHLDKLHPKYSICGLFFYIWAVLGGRCRYPTTPYIRIWVYKHINYAIYTSCYFASSPVALHPKKRVSNLAKSWISHEFQVIRKGALPKSWNSGNNPLSQLSNGNEKPP